MAVPFPWIGVFTPSGRACGRCPQAVRLPATWRCLMFYTDLESERRRPVRCSACVRIYPREG